jgi:8-oxo-dGTP pyrophosphatase MutT (NUDIX family)
VSAEIVALTDFRGALLPGPMPMSAEDAAAVDAHWARRSADNPSFFDGRVLMAESFSVEDGRLRADYRELRFAAFLWWKSQDFPARGPFNVFGAAAVVSSDGAVLLGRMGDHTANPGQLYFPAGTPDLGDVFDGTVDLEGSVARELEEETGLAEPLVRPTDRKVMVRTGNLIACVRRFDCDLTADELDRRVKAHFAGEDDPELHGVAFVRSAEELGSSSPAYVHAVLPHLL